MPKRDDDLLISDMIECSRKILDFADDMDYGTFINDAKTQNELSNQLKFLEQVDSNLKN